MSHVSILTLSLEDLPAIVNIHAAAFPDSALTALGRESVHRYYDWLLTGPHDAVTFGAFQDTKLLGYCFSGTFNGALSGFLHKNRGFLLWRVLTHPWLLTNPLFRDRLQSAYKLLKRFRLIPSGNKHRMEDTIKRRRSSFGVLSIAVDVAAQGLGVGKSLMMGAEQRAREAGFIQMHLTVHPDNHQAVGFYEHVGWSKDGQDEAGNWNGRMIKLLE